MMIVKKVLILINKRKKEAELDVNCRSSAEL